MYNDCVSLRENFVKSNSQQSDIFHMSQIILNPKHFFPNSYLMRHTLKLCLASDRVVL